MLVVYAYYVQEFGTIANSKVAAVKDAHVILNSENAADTLIFVETSHRYEARPKNLTIDARQSYTLQVRLATGKLLMATCTVPDLPDLPNVDGLRREDDYVFQIRWTNLANHPYFAIAVSGIGNYQQETPKGIFTVPVSARLDGGSYVLGEQRDVSLVSGIVRNAYRSSAPGVRVLLRNLDPNMYLYYDTYQKLDDWASNNDEGGLPNFREQRTIYSNITNGVGVFGAYNTSSADFDI